MKNKRKEPRLGEVDEEFVLILTGTIVGVGILALAMAVPIVAAVLILLIIAIVLCGVTSLFYQSFHILSRKYKAKHQDDNLIDEDEIVVGEQPVDNGHIRQIQINTKNSTQTIEQP